MSTAFTLSGVMTVSSTLAAVLTVVSVVSLSAAEPEAYLRHYCLDCHGSNDSEGGISLVGIDVDIAQGADVAKWKKIAERIAMGEMPPEDAQQPSVAESAAILQTLKGELVRGGEDVSDIGRQLRLPGHGNRVPHTPLFSGEITSPVASPARLWRIRPQSYVSFLPQIGGSSVTAAQPFSAHSGEGFKDYAALFVIDEPTISQLLRNAELLVSLQCGAARGKAVEQFALLLDEDREPTRSDLEAAISFQFHRALLRAPTAEETDRFVELMHRNIDDAGRRIGVIATLSTVLLLPESLYRYELGQGELDEYGRVMLSPRQLAYAIAYALTDKSPDRQLLAAAEEGRLTSVDDVRREVERLLNDPQVDTPQVMRFFDEYFEYPAAVDVFKDIKKGHWRPDVLVNDTRLLIQRVLDDDREVLRRLLTTRESFVNAVVDSKTGQLQQARKVKLRTPKRTMTVSRYSFHNANHHTKSRSTMFMVFQPIGSGPTSSR